MVDTALWWKERVNFFFFTSESVNEGHPDKLRHHVSDTVLDLRLKQDVCPKVA